MVARRVASAALVVGALLIIAAIAGYWLLANPSPAKIQATPPSLVTNDKGASASIAAHNTPSVAVDPRDPSHVVLAERVDRPRFGCMVHFSSDGGLNWTDSAVILPAGQDTCYIPDVAFNRGTVFLVYLTLNTHPLDPLSGGNDPNGTWLARSADGGRTFGTPLDLHGHDNLQPRLAVDPNDGRLYVVYIKGSPFQNESPLGFGPPPNPILVTSSIDDGLTFSLPVQVNDPARVRVAAPTPLVTANGDLMVLYEDYQGDLNDYNNKAVPFNGTHALVLATSSDHGTTFRQSVVDPAQVRPHAFLIYLPPFPALAADPTGRTLYAAWSDARDGAPDILLRRSTDQGQTWGAPLKINRRTVEPSSFELPALAASKGRVEVIFFALTGAHPMGKVQYSFSTDAGGTFSVPSAISNAFDGTVGVPSARDLGSIDLGARLALVPLGSTGRTLAAWSDSSRGSQNTGRSDIFASQVSP